MTTSTVTGHTSVEDHQAIGERARVQTPLSSQADWMPAPERPDPVELLIEQNTTREADLVPVRHGRMTVSPFTFYRGAAKVMATDLATTRWPAWLCSSAATPTCPTSAASSHQSANCCSGSTTSMRLRRDR